jgi:predicted flap endonuclease-1-like 5' DNA nuclease
MNKKTVTLKPVWPRGVAAPAQRALAGAGITQLEQLAKWTESDLLALHGMGPKAIGLLRDALRAKGLAFKA